MTWGLKHIPSRELTEWYEYYKLEPFGENITQQQLAAIAAILATANSTEKFKTEDFLPRITEEQPQSSEENNLRIIELINALFGGQERKKK